MGIRAVPKGYYVKITFTADDGYVFEKSGKSTYEVRITKLDNDIIFGSPDYPDYPLPKVIEE